MRVRTRSRPCVSRADTQQARFFRLYADATGCSLLLPEEEASVLLGTAVVAAVAGGIYQSVSAAAQAMTREKKIIDPQPHTREYFDQQYRRFLLMHKHRRELAGRAA